MLLEHAWLSLGALGRLEDADERVGSAGEDVPRRPGRGVGEGQRRPLPNLEVPRAATDCPSGEKASRVRPGVCTGRASTDDGAGWWGAMGGFPRPIRGGEGEARGYGSCWRRVTCWAVGDESAEGLMKRRGGLETTTTDGRVFETRRRAGDEAENCSCKSPAGRRKGAAPAGPKTSLSEHRRRPPSR
jgi:hypothetical protein